MTTSSRIVIVGGGAGGLELATRLGRAAQKLPGVSILLIDKYPFHIWKPLFHEVASGSLDVDMDGVDYRAHAANNGFEFQLGTLRGLDRPSREVALEAICDQSGEVLVPLAALKPVPVIVSMVPPARLPLEGVTEDPRGAGVESFRVHQVPRPPRMHVHGGPVAGEQAARPGVVEVDVRQEEVGDPLRRGTVSLEGLLQPLVAGGRSALDQKVLVPADHQEGGCRPGQVSKAEIERVDVHVPRSAGARSR